MSHLSRTCPGARELFQYANRMVVEEADEAALEAHVANCPPCRVRAASLAGAIAPRLPLELPPDLLGKIHARIAAREAAAQAPPPRRLARYKGGLVLAGAVAAVLALVAGRGLLVPAIEPPPAVAPTAEVPPSDPGITASAGDGVAPESSGR